MVLGCWRLGAFGAWGLGWCGLGFGALWLGGSGFRGLGGAKIDLRTRAYANQEQLNFPKKPIIRYLGLGQSLCRLALFGRAYDYWVLGAFKP